MPRDVAAINVRQRLALATDGSIGCITTLIDADGDDTDVAEEAIAAVVCLSETEWVIVLVADYERIEVH